ncbi:response regulator [Halobacteriovorax sp. HLS]|uniref:response regulator n=1 Tax=Halobacteriovorax sp. HLS TaxID=2234000 RepID=UPI000FDC1049|nr:response regulator [Halobacteriovorax sp. HLS]
MDLDFLVIDDSMEMVKLLNSFIVSGNLGHGHSFENELKAMEFVGENCPDILIIDVNLNYINGFKLGELIRSMLKLEIPIIYISSNDLYLKDFYDADQRNTYFMNKPFDKETFKNVIEKMAGDPSKLNDVE